MTGFVKKILKEKNFGFIDASGKEYFFHRDDYKGDSWQELIVDVDAGIQSVLVEFEDVPSSKGPRASDVRRV